MRLRVGGLVAVLTIVIAACGGGGDEAAPGAGSATEPAPATAFESVVTTAAPPTSATIPNTTAAPPTTPATTTAPTTTIDPAKALAAEVEADFRRARELELLASMDPTDEEAVDAALDARIGPAREYLSARFVDLRDSGLAIRPNPNAEAVSTIEVPASPVVQGSGVVELVECEIDPWILVEVGGAPNGSDAIVDDAVYAYRRVVILRDSSTGWKVEGARTNGEWVGVEECPAP